MSTEPEPTESEGHLSPPKTGWIRRMYDWTLSWAEHPKGPLILFALAFTESSFFPIPPDVLLLALCMGLPKKSFKFALMCSIGSVLGGIAGYGIGYWGFEAVGQPIIDFYGKADVMDKIKAYYDQYGFLGILIAAITPIPYKVFTIASGFFQYNFLQFVIASVIGRSFRFFCVSAMIYYFGPTVKKLIDKYFNLFAWGFMVLLILGFIAIKFLHH